MMRYVIKNGRYFIDLQVTIFLFLTGYFYRLIYLFIHMHLFILKNSIDWFHNCAFLLCSFFSKILLYSIIRRSVETVGSISNHKFIETSTTNRYIVTLLFGYLHRGPYPITDLSKYWQPIVTLHLANFIVALIQSQHSIKTLTSNRCIVTLHLVNFIVAFIQSHSSIETLTSNRYIVIFSLTLSWFLSNLQIYRNIEIQSIYRYFIFD